MKKFEQVNFNSETPETSAYYDTNMGFLKYDRFTRSFYNDNFPVKVAYFFREIKEIKKGFEKAVEPAIRYLLKNHDPHTKIIIDYSAAELVQGKKSHNLNIEVPD